MRLGRSGPTVSAAVLALAALGAAACGSSTAPASKSSYKRAGSISTTRAGGSTFTVEERSNPTYGDILVTGAGFALYTYGPDNGHNGLSTCTGSCLQAWPPLSVPAGKTPTGGPGVTGTLGVVKQANGTYQVTYDGLPLYTFVQDSAAAEVTGNNVAGFSVAKASGSDSSATSSSTTASTTSPTASTTPAGTPKTATPPTSPTTYYQY